MDFPYSTGENVWEKVSGQNGNIRSNVASGKIIW